MCSSVGRSLASISWRFSMNAAAISIDREQIPRSFVGGLLFRDDLGRDECVYFVGTFDKLIPMDERINSIDRIPPLIEINSHAPPAQTIFAIHTFRLDLPLLLKI